MIMCLVAPRHLWVRASLQTFVFGLPLLLHRVPGSREDTATVFTWIPRTVRLSCVPDIRTVPSTGLSDCRDWRTCRGRRQSWRWRCRWGRSPPGTGGGGSAGQEENGRDLPAPSWRSGGTRTSTPSGTTAQKKTIVNETSSRRQVSLAQRGTSGRFMK